jgi:hypothetical protein
MKKIIFLICSVFVYSNVISRDTPVFHIADAGSGSDLDFNAQNTIHIHNKAGEEVSLCQCDDSDALCKDDNCIPITLESGESAPVSSRHIVLKK